MLSRIRSSANFNQPYIFDSSVVSDTNLFSGISQFLFNRGQLSNPVEARNDRLPGSIYEIPGEIEKVEQSMENSNDGSTLITTVMQHRIERMRLFDVLRGKDHYLNLNTPNTITNRGDNHVKP